MDWKKGMVPALKISAGCIVAIVIAQILKLEYAITAGIITILSVQNTKKDTLKTAAKRGFAFLCALGISWCCYQVLGYTTVAFCVYVILFLIVCIAAGWQSAMAMDSVLISHFLAKGTMDIDMLYNECMLFLIGAGAGVLVNITLHRDEKAFNRLAESVDESIRGVLIRMAERLTDGNLDGYDGSCFVDLNTQILEAEACALKNRANTLFHMDQFELSYVHMRQKQMLVLEEIYKSIVRIKSLTKQRIVIAEFVEKIAREFARENDVKNLLEELEIINNDMKRENLPADREEFEARAVLFYILRQLEELLRLKREFALEKGKQVK